MEKVLRIIIFLSISINYGRSQTETQNPNAFLSTPSLIRKYGYPSETHTVQTKDGYLLSLHRIPHNKSGDYSQRPAIFLQHGILGSSFDWVILGPEYSLAFLLSDAGYDVWLGNFRGNTYSMESSVMPVTNKEYWDFSWDDYALFDLPAMMNYILQATEQKKLKFIGFSMGASVAFALISSQPAFNKKISLLLALAPTSYLRNSKIPEKIFGPWSKEIEYLDKVLLKGQVFPKKTFAHAEEASCERKEMEKFCDTIVTWIDGKMSINKSISAMVLNNFPAGSSIKVLDQVSQQVETGDFCRFDYGPVKNLEIYKSVKPPLYKLNKVKLPVAAFYSDVDSMATPPNVRQITDELPNVIQKTYISDKNFTHFDFIYSTKAKPEVYDSILQLLEL